MIDPRNLKFKKTSQAGKTIHQIIDTQNKKYPKIIWSGPSSKLLQNQFELLFKIIIEQTNTIDEIEQKLEQLVAESNLIEIIE